MEGPAIGQEVGLARVRRRWRWHHGSDRDERGRASEDGAPAVGRGGIQRQEIGELLGHTPGRPQTMQLLY